MLEGLREENQGRKKWQNLKEWKEGAIPESNNGFRLKYYRMIMTLLPLLKMSAVSVPIAMLTNTYTRLLRSALN